MALQFTITILQSSQFLKEHFFVSKLYSFLLTKVTFSTFRFVYKLKQTNVVVLKQLRHTKNTFFKMFLYSLTKITIVTFFKKVQTLILEAFSCLILHGLVKITIAVSLKMFVFKNAN